MKKFSSGLVGVGRKGVGARVAENQGSHTEWDFTSTCSSDSVVSLKELIPGDVLLGGLDTQTHR